MSHASMSVPTRTTFYPFADGAALHREGSHRVWVLSHSSAVLWCLLEEHGPGEPLVAAFAGLFGLSAEQARADVRSALADFVGSGLLEERQVVSSQPSALSLNPEDQGFDLPVADHRSPGALPAASPQPPASGPQVAAPWSQSYRMAGVTWQVSASNGAFAETCLNCFAHLATRSTHHDLHFQLSEDASGWTLVDPTATLTGVPVDGVLPALLTQLFAELCARQPQHLLLHAAVARRSGRLLLLPGESTYGKSTLAAALAAHGWTLYSDELAPLNPATLETAPFPLPVGIKSRSLGALESCFPELASQPPWQRADGQVVRYLAPPHIDLADPDGAAAPVDIIIFPRFQPDTPTRLERLDPLDALQRLARTGSSQRPLRADDVRALLTLAGQRPCWGLAYGVLAEAVGAIERLVNRAGTGTF